MPRSASEWASVERYARRRELYERAAAVFRRDGYRNATLKALASACGLSIPALYRYFPSKRAFALFPLVVLHPELHPLPADLDSADPAALLLGWVDAAVETLPYYTLALKLAREADLTRAEQRRIETNMAEHIATLAGIARRCAPQLEERSARDLAATMISVASGPAATGLDADPGALRRQLRTLLRAYGIILAPPVRSSSPG